MKHCFMYFFFFFVVLYRPDTSVCISECYNNIQNRQQSGLFEISLCPFFFINNYFHEILYSHSKNVHFIIHIGKTIFTNNYIIFFLLPSATELYLSANLQQQ